MVPKCDDCLTEIIDEYFIPVGIERIACCYECALKLSKLLNTELGNENFINLLSHTLINEEN
ncbi:MAG: hypothetical protein H0Z33_11020 [Bacillaceae bacterium]|nr:hypothetical protein [Bacillaceae bacterium]